MLSGAVSDPRVPTLILACGALAREIRSLIGRPGMDHMVLRCLPAGLHNRPERIPEAVRTAIRDARRTGGFERILIGYADCGTGGLLDRVCAEEGVERLPGPHCYALFGGIDSFAGDDPDDITSFYLTDFLVRQFRSLVVRGLGLDRHPELRDMYFGHYTRMVYLAQTDDPGLQARAEAAAMQLGLPLQVRHVGLGGLEHHVRAAAA